MPWVMETFVSELPSGAPSIVYCVDATIPYIWGSERSTMSESLPPQQALSSRLAAAATAVRPKARRPRDLAISLLRKATRGLRADRVDGGANYTVLSK